MQATQIKITPNMWALGETLLWNSGLDRDYGVEDINREQLRKLDDEFWAWLYRCTEAMVVHGYGDYDIDQLHMGPFCHDDRPSAIDYVNTRLACGTGFWDAYRWQLADILYRECRADGYLEGLVDNGDGTLDIA